MYKVIEIPSSRRIFCLLAFILDQIFRVPEVVYGGDFDVLTVAVDEVDWDAVAFHYAGVVGKFGSVG